MSDEMKRKRLGGWMLIIILASVFMIVFSINSAVAGIGVGSTLVSSSSLSSSSSSSSRSDGRFFCGTAMMEDLMELTYRMLVGALILFSQITLLIACIFHIASIKQILQRRPFFLRYAQTGYILGIVSSVLEILFLQGFDARYLESATKNHALFILVMYCMGVLSYSAYFPQSERVRHYMDNDTYLVWGFFVRRYWPVNTYSTPDGKSLLINYQRSTYGSDNALFSALFGIGSILFFSSVIGGLICGIIAIAQSSKAYRKNYPSLGGMSSGIVGMLASVLFIVNQYSDL